MSGPPVRAGHAPHPRRRFPLRVSRFIMWRHRSEIRSSRALISSTSPGAVKARSFTSETLRSASTLAADGGEAAFPWPAPAANSRLAFMASACPGRPGDAENGRRRNTHWCRHLKGRDRSLPRLASRSVRGGSPRECLRNLPGSAPPLQSRQSAPDGFRIIESSTASSVRRSARSRITGMPSGLRGAAVGHGLLVHGVEFGASSSRLPGWT